MQQVENPRGPGGPFHRDHDSLACLPDEAPQVPSAFAGGALFLKQIAALPGNGYTAMKTELTTTKTKETFKKAQPLPRLTGAPAMARYAAPTCQAGMIRPALAAPSETMAAVRRATVAAPSSARWIGLDAARDTSGEGIALGVLALAAMACIAQAFGAMGELAPNALLAGAWVARLIG
jgi:hypothetical protein